MRLARESRMLRTTRTWGRLVLFVASIALVVGCPVVNPPVDNGNDNGNTNGNDNISTDAVIINIATNIGISELETPVSVLYNVGEDAEDVRGYYVPVAGAATDSPPIGDRMIAATGLDTGERQAFSFDPGEAGVGYFRVGILFDLGSALGETAESDGVIEVQGPPDPSFILPANDINEVVSGDAVQIAFDVRDPQAIVQWRVFYTTPQDPLDGPADEFGTEIASGSGNVGNVTLLTEDLALGDYQLGLSATDSGSSIAATVASRQSHRIVTIPAATGTTPIVRIIAAP